VKKRTTRTAWWLSAILAVALLGGFGAALAHGINLGSTEVRMVLLNHWDVGTVRFSCCVTPCETQMTSVGYFAVVVDRSLGPPPDPQVTHLLYEWAAKRTAIQPRPLASRLRPTAKTR
jgi:hypothetical protein